MEVKTPTPDQVKLIYKDTYYLYIKYQNCYKDEEWIELVNETHELSHKYPFDLCKVILVELLEIIEKVYMSKSKLDRVRLLINPGVKR